MQNNFNTLKDTLTTQDIDSILCIVGHRCRIKTYNRLRSILTYGKHTIPSYGILERLYRDDKGNWKYCAGQSYPDEIRTLREIILKG